MVLLKQETQVDQKTHPFTFWWETLRRKKHNDYETQINKILFASQRWLQTPFWANFMFPKYYQHNLLDLQIYRALQKLGDFTPEEIAQYSQISPRVKSDIKAAFGTPIPVYSLVAAAGLFAYFFKARFNLFHAVAVSLVPVAGEVIWKKWDTQPKHEALKFLEWSVESRKAKSILETNQAKFSQSDLQAFKEAYPNKTLFEAYRDYLVFLGK